MHVKDDKKRKQLDCTLVNMDNSLRENRLWKQFSTNHSIHFQKIKESPCVKTIKKS